MVKVLSAVLRVVTVVKARVDTELWQDQVMPARQITSLVARSDMPTGVSLGGGPGARRQLSCCEFDIG
jgi:hypothetical protein